MSTFRGPTPLADGDDDTARLLHRDRHLANLAAEQHGVVSRDQLYVLGFGEAIIEARCARGLLHRAGTGVYAVGHPGISRRGRGKAALLHVGPRAGLSHDTAARLWGMVGPATDGPIHVSVQGRSDVVEPPGVVVHRPRNLLDDDIVAHRGLRVTTPERTVVDQLRGSGVNEITRMLEQMVTQLGRSPDALHAWGHALPSRPGRGTLFRALDNVAGPAVIRSEFETLFRSLCQEAGLPPAITNYRIAGEETDAVWLTQRVAVELDSWRWHGGRWQFHRDRRKGLVISRAGYELVRISWPQLKYEQPLVIEALRYALARGEQRTGVALGRAA